MLRHLYPGGDAPESTGQMASWAPEQVWVKCCEKCLSRPGMRIVLSDLPVCNLVILPGYCGCLLIGNCVIYESNDFRN
jgi:hypothetical protein